MKILSFYKKFFYCSEKKSVEDFLKKMKIYAEKQSIGSSASLHDFMIKILKDSKFQEDPGKYIQQWKQKRGGSEEFRMPEDQALLFFEKEISYLKRLYKK
jgi:hypothetical protein